jgi:DNA-binding ferritin-like protein (Dps family)
MKVFDKALWHIDAGESRADVLERFRAVMAFLDEKNLLSEDGQEILDIGVDDSIALTDSMMTDEGTAFLDKYYDEVINCAADEITAELNRRYNP